MSPLRAIAAATALREVLLTASILTGGMAFLSGCGHEGRAPGTQSKLIGAPRAAPLTELLERMVGAPQRVAFEATRRYEACWRVDGVDEVLAYRERVVSDGKGGFSIDPIEVLEPGMTSAERDLFLLLQKAREGFFFKHRDVGIRDLQLLLMSWQVVDRGQTGVLGRPCALLDISRRQDPDRTYHLAVDGQNGLILRAEERDRRGKLVSRLDYESLDLTPSIDAETLHHSLANETIVASGSELQAALSFHPVQPKLLPRGYRLLETAAVADPSPEGGEWARYTYGDGIEELFFLHKGGASGPTAPAGSGPGGRGVGAQPSPAGREQRTVRFLYVGPWTVLFGELDRGAFVAMGKVSRESLQDLVESAFF